MEQKKGKVLIIDDNSKNIQLAASVLDMHNYEVEFALDGLSGIKWLEEEEFDLILLDVMMPGLDGFETCKRIRKKNELVPIIFLTAKTDRNSIAEGFKSGGNDYIVKPFDAIEFVVRVQNQIELKRNREQLEQMNINLEKLVKEKTEELQIKNQALNNINMELIAANDELKAIEGSKQQFLNIIGHEIGGVVHDSIGILQVIKYKIDSRSTSQLIDKVDGLLYQLNNYVDTSLRVSELQSSKTELKLERLNLNKVIGFTLYQLDVKLRQKQISVKNVDISKDLHILGEAQLINTLLFSVFDFLCDRNSAKSNITILIKNDNDTELQIYDDGAQIPDKELQTYFDFFSSGLSSLYFAKSIADAHGFKMSVENRQKKGVVFSIIFS